MKASELIKELQTLITTHGDLPIYGPGGPDSELEEIDYTTNDDKVAYFNIY